MNELEDEKKETSDANEAFFEKTDKAFRALFDSARAKNELDFAFALEPEERGYQNSGWSSAAETFIAFDDYLKFLNEGETTRFKLRVALSFYCHLSEASGFYEVPKKLLLVSEGDPYFRKAFSSIVAKHRTTGKAMAPNASRVFRDLVGHAKNLGFDDLAEVFEQAFDPELRNAYAHSNYILRPTELRIKDKATNKIRILLMPEFSRIFNKGLGFFQILRNVLKEYMKSYDPVKVITGRLHDEPETPCKIEYLPQFQVLSISRIDDYWRWVIDAREIFADELNEEAEEKPRNNESTDS